MPQVHVAFVVHSEPTKLESSRALGGGIETDAARAAMHRSSSQLRTELYVGRRLKVGLLRPMRCALRA
jgi:hypothetical protein